MSAVVLEPQTIIDRLHTGQNEHDKQKILESGIGSRVHSLPPAETGMSTFMYNTAHGTPKALALKSLRPLCGTAHVLGEMRGGGSVLILAAYHFHQTHRYASGIDGSLMLLVVAAS